MSNLYGLDPLYTASSLSNGALNTIMNENQVDSPIVQVLTSHNLLHHNYIDGRRRYRLLLNDGTYFSSFAVLSLKAARLRRIINESDMDGLPKYCIIKLKRYNTSFVDYLENAANRLVLIISDFELVAGRLQISRKLGNPVTLPEVNHQHSSISHQPITRSQTQSDRNSNSSLSKEANSASTLNSNCQKESVSNQTANGSEENLLSNQPVTGSKSNLDHQNIPVNGSTPNSNHQERSILKRPFNRREPISDFQASSSTTQVHYPCSPPKRRSLNNYSYFNVFLRDEERRTISNIYPELNLVKRFYKWVVKALILNKSSIHTYWEGTGKVFSVDLLDETGEIRCTGFSDVVDKLYDFIQVGQVYYISNLLVKKANMYFNHLNNPLELNFTSESIVEEADDDASQSLFSNIKFDFRSIDGITKMKVDEKLDVIGICTRHTQLESFTSQEGKNLKKRELILVDESNSSVSLTIWGSEAQNYNQYLPIVAVKGAVVHEFLGSKNLSLPKTGIILYNPDLKESHDLRNWYAAGGDKEELLNITTRRCEVIQCNLVSFKEVKDLGKDAAEPGIHFLTKGTIVQTKAENSYYKGCPLTTCHKKVIKTESGMYRCSKCNASFLTFKYEIATEIHVSDWRGIQCLSVFSRNAEFLFGKSAPEIARIGERYGQSSEEYQNIINGANLKQFMFRYRGKIDSYNNEERLRNILVNMEKIDFKKYNSFLISNIVQLIC